MVVNGVLFGVPPGGSKIITSGYCPSFFSFFFFLFFFFFFFFFFFSLNIFHEGIRMYIEFSCHMRLPDVICSYFKVRTPVQVAVC